MEFGFHRGSLALDFVGTLRHRAWPRPEERLADAAALAQWFHAAGIGDVAVAERDVAGARALREAIARVLGGIHDGEALAQRDVACINRHAADAGIRQPRLTSSGTVRQARETSRSALGRVALDAIELIAHRKNRLVRCALPQCGALLLSASRGKPRRWCSMETCGNVAKAAAHRERKRTTRQGASMRAV